MTTPTALTADEYQVLTRYARRQSITDISRLTGISVPKVSSIVTDLVGMDRGRAVELVRVHEAAEAKARRNGVAAAVFQQPPTVSPLVAPVVAPAAKVPTAPPPAEPAQPTPPPSLEALLVLGQAHPHTRIRAIAVKAGALLDTLRARLDEDEQARAADVAAEEAREKARARIATLERQLEAARAVLRPAGKPKTAAAAKDLNRAVRRWAADSGIECQARGQIPAAIWKAYKAAHPD